MDRPPPAPLNRLVVLLVAAGLVVAGCSSTSTQSGRKGGSQSVASASGAESTTELETVAESPEAAASGGVSPAKAGSKGAGGAAPGTPAAAGASPNPLGAVRAPTGGKLEIGLITEAPITAGGTIGATKNIDYGDIRAQWQAIVAYINAHGGIAGRRVVPVYFEENQNSDNYAAVSQAACAHFAEDNHVFAVVSTFLAHAELAECLAAKKVPLISQSRIPYDRTTFAQIGDYLYMPGRMNGTRWGGAMIDRLLAQGYFAKGAKMGLARFDAKVNKRISDEAIKPRMTARGLKLTEEVAVSTPGTIGDFGGVAAQASNAVLRFRSSGVTHVMFNENNGILPFLFMPAAASQGFHPRYGLQSENGIETLAYYYPAELKGALSVGWLPAEDVFTPQDPNDNPAAKVCDDLIAKAGLAPKTERVGYKATRSECDGLFFLKHALDRASAVTAAGLKAAVEKLGDSYNSPLTFTTRFFPGRHDGASSVRPVRFEDGCACWKYYGDNVPVP